MIQNRSLFVFLALLLLASCSGRDADPRLVPEETFVRLYADILISREERTLRGPGDADSAPTDSLCRAYGVALADVDHTLKYHQRDLPSWKQFHEKVIQRLELLRQEMASKRTKR